MQQTSYVIAIHPVGAEPCPVIAETNTSRKPAELRLKCCKKILKIAVAFLVVTAALTFLLSSTNHNRVQRILSWIDEHQDAGFFIFLLIYIVSTVAFVPVTVLSIAAGAIFGFWQGALLVWLGANIGETAAFLIGRFLLRSHVKKLASKHQMWHAVELCLREEGWKMVLLLRMAPILPFAVLNYALGSSAVRFGPFFLASTLGIIPALLLHTYLGSLLPSIADIDDQTGVPRSTRILVLVFTITSGVLVVATAAILARRALLQRIAAMEQLIQQAPASPHTAPPAAGSQGAQVQAHPLSAQTSWDSVHSLAPPPAEGHANNLVEPLLSAALSTP